MYRHILIIFTLIAALVATPTADGRRRTSKDVRRDRQKTEQEISRTRKQISENDKETSRQLNRLNLMNATMTLRADTIRGIKARLDSVNTRIKALNDSIGVLTVREKSLKANYAKSLRAMRARRQSMSDLAFIFSAESFGQAWRRIRYLREIAKTSTRQAQQIKTAAESLTAARQQLDVLKAEHTSSLARLNTAQATMSRERASADNLVSTLRKQGRSLNRELSRRRQQAADLDRELNRIVEQEIREAEARREAERKRLAREKAAKEAAERKKAEANRAKPSKESPSGNDLAEAKPAQQPAPAKSKSTAPAPKATSAYASQAEADRRLTGSFASNKGRLLFPVAGRYTITSKFGTYNHPDFAKVKMNNLGIDIEVPQGTSTRAVFDGVVSSIFRLDGYHNVVILRHGEYLTVYAGIDALAVKKGDKVKAGQNIGSLYSDHDDGGRTSLHFEIRHEKQKLNPSEWVR